MAPDARPPGGRGGAGTWLTVAEQGACLDGYDDAGNREQGTGLLLDALGASLKGAAGPGGTGDARPYPS